MMSDTMGMHQKNTGSEKVHGLETCRLRDLRDISQLQCIELIELNK